nr:hypothetical protein CFP56_42065 [Quercus suber]
MLREDKAVSKVRGKSDAQSPTSLAHTIAAHSIATSVALVWRSRHDTVIGVGLDVFLEILRALERLAAKVAFVWLERDVDADVGGDVVAFHGSGATGTPLTGEVEVVGTLPADMTLANVILNKDGSASIETGANRKEVLLISTYIESFGRVCSFAASLPLTSEVVDGRRMYRVWCLHRRRRLLGLLLSLLSGGLNSLRKALRGAAKDEVTVFALPRRSWRRRNASPCADEMSPNDDMPYFEIAHVKHVHVLETSPFEAPHCIFLSRRRDEQDSGGCACAPSPSSYAIPRILDRHFAYEIKGGRSDGTVDAARNDCVDVAPVGFQDRGATATAQQSNSRQRALYGTAVAWA